MSQFKYLLETSTCIPEQFLDDNNSWKALTKQEKAMLTEAQLYAYERFWMSIHDEEIAQISQ